MTLIYSLAAALVVMSGSLAGVLFLSNRLGTWMRRHIAILATFSAGVLAVLAGHLTVEAFHESESVWFVVVGILAGIALLEIVHRLIPDAHHHHEATDHAHSEIEGRRVLLSDAVHNVTDGFLIVSAFVADWRIGVAATFGIFLHECVQEISEFFVLKHAGYSDSEALRSNFAASSTILIGVVIAYVFASSGVLISILSAIAAGGFISVVMSDLVPHAWHSAKRSGRIKTHIAAVLLGAALMYGLTVIIPHDHHEEEPVFGPLPMLALTR